MNRTLFCAELALAALAAASSDEITGTLDGQGPALQGEDAAF